MLRCGMAIRGRRSLGPGYVLALLKVRRPALPKRLIDGEGAFPDGKACQTLRKSICFRPDFVTFAGSMPSS
jgi:hypothetical protein